MSKMLQYPCTKQIDTSCILRIMNETRVLRSLFMIQYYDKTSHGFRIDNYLRTRIGGNNCYVAVELKEKNTLHHLA